MSFDHERHKECDKTVCCGKHSLGNFKSEWISRVDPSGSRERTVREGVRGKSGSEEDWLFKHKEISNTQD